uniref:Ig-like domain-containing protein n=1 Tax=Kryptolebias marmoratus TaxID=37003 RepID=A0A3Q3ENL9_KRYMA
MMQKTCSIETVCPSELVEAVYSEDTVLPCHLEPPTDATDNRVEWRRGNDVVHLYQGGKEDPAEQRETFEGRTSLFPEGLTKGNLSLKLSSVRLEDSGSYLCSFHTLDQSCLVNLRLFVSADAEKQLPVHVTTATLEFKNKHWDLGGLILGYRSWL